MKWIKSTFAILMVFNVLFLTVIYQPSQAYANVATKPLTITAKKVAKDLAKDSAVAMANDIVSNYLVRELIEGATTESGYAAVCMDGPKDNIKDCPADKRAQVKKDITSSDRSKLASTVENVLEKKTNTSAKWQKFLDFFIPIFLISGLVATFDAMLDGDSESLIDEIAQEALIDTGLLKPLQVQTTTVGELYDFADVIQNTVVEITGTSPYYQLIINNQLKSGKQLTMTVKDLRGQTYTETFSSNYWLKFNMSGSESVVGYKHYPEGYQGSLYMNTTSRSASLNHTHYQGTTGYDTSSAAYADGASHMYNNHLMKFKNLSGDVNAVNNLLSQYIAIGKGSVSYSLNLLTPPEVETNYGTQTGLNKTKNPDGTKTLPGVNSFTYTYNNTYVYPATDSTTGWKDKTTGKDITVVEDDVVVDEGTTPVDPETPPEEDEEGNENDFVCKREMKFPDFKPIGSSFTNAFPFSIPWDIKRFLDSAFSGIGSERPKVDLSGFFGSGVVLEIPAYFDSWVNIAQKFIVVLFDISIIYLFYRFMKGGND